jgi:hypothetical protein
MCTSSGQPATNWPVVKVADDVVGAILDRYQSHPRHRGVIERMSGGIVSGPAVVDFEMPPPANPRQKLSNTQRVL